MNVTVNQTPERVRRWIASNDPPYRTLYDDKGVSTRAYEAPVTSYIVIIDAAGKVAYTGTGADQDLAGALARVTTAVADAGRLPPPWWRRSPSARSPSAVRAALGAQADPKRHHPRRPPES